jgi:hypothetical protein
MWPCKNKFSHPSLVIYNLATPPIKLKLGPANRRATTNSKPPGPIIMMTQSETLSSSQSDHHIYCTLLWRCRAMRIELCYYAEPKPFCWAKPARFDFSSSNCNLQDSILSTAGDALIKGTRAMLRAPGHEHSCVLHAKGRGIDSSEFLRGWEELTIDFWFQALK